MERPEDYRWSSDRLFRHEAAAGLLDRDAALALLAPSRKAAMRAYYLLMDGFDTPEYDELQGIARVVKGDEDFALELIGRNKRFEPALRGPRSSAFSSWWLR